MMKLPDIPRLGNKITKEDETLINLIQDITDTITEKFDSVPFTDGLIILTGIIYKLIDFREEFLTDEDAGFENEHDVKRFNYLVRLMNDKLGTKIEQLPL